MISTSIPPVPASTTTPSALQAAPHAMPSPGTVSDSSYELTASTKRIYLNSPKTALPLPVNEHRFTTRHILVSPFILVKSNAACALTCGEYCRLLTMYFNYILESRTQKEVRIGGRARPRRLRPECACPAESKVEANASWLAKTRRRGETPEVEMQPGLQSRPSREALKSV